MRGLRMSVIIPTCRGAGTLRQCVESVLADTPPSPEIILVDNGSDPATREVIRSLEPRVTTVVRLDRNLGYAGGNNAGVRRATGEILFLLNDDARVLPGTLSTTGGRMLQNPSIGIAGAKIYDPDGHTLQHAGAVLNRHAVSRHRGAGEEDTGQYDVEKDVEFVTGTAWAVTRDLWDRLGGLSEVYFPGYYEETEFCWAARRLGRRVVYLPGARVVHHGMRTTGRLSMRYHYYYHRHRLRYFLRTREKGQVGPFLRGELGWLLSLRNPEQFIPLLGAYLWNGLSLPATLSGRRELWRRLG